MRRLITLLLLSLAAFGAQPGWWMTEPIRWVQTNLRQTDATLDARRLVAQLADMRANVLLEGMGGIVAYYPTRVEFHYPSPDLPPGRDLFGEILSEAHAHRIRVVGRFDFSKTRKAVFDAHPEWFFRQANGEPVIYNGLYSTCINGGYYRAQAMKILAEALERYEVDGLFFNMFGNQSRDYGGREVGLCHCDACRRLYRERFGKEIPAKPDDDYRRFMFASSREVAAAIGDLIHARRPQAGYFNYIQEYTDGVMSESNTAVARPLPLWPYSASDNVNRARNSQPAKMAVNLNMQFVDYWWRFATVPAGEIALRCWQNLAHGGALTFEVNGTLDQQDRQALDTVTPIFRWAAEHERYYARQTSAARVLLLGAPLSSGRPFDQESYRGLFRLLSEEHIPFAVSDNMDWLGRRDFDLVVACGWAPAALEQYAAKGGRVLIASATPPEFSVVAGSAGQGSWKGYVRVRRHADFPSLRNTDLLMLDGPVAQLPPDPDAALTLVPPSMIGPPEFVHIDMRDTDTPAIARRSVGKGAVTWIPWNLGALYYRHSLPAHAALFRDSVDRLMPRRQLTASAHPLVEMTLMKQDGRTLLHVINLSGHSQTAYFEAIPMSDISVRVDGVFRTAKSLIHGDLRVRSESGSTGFTIPRLGDYDLIVLE
ncbi:MAG: hypothetical protein JSU00_22115 [Acidobacteria bacterium]|nr:hypothetical protein [Acidobacteriota bacterium]